MAGLKRFFGENIVVGEEFELTGEEFEHAKNVLRLGEGDEAILLDGSGDEFVGVCSKANKKSLVFRVLRKETGEREPKTEVSLAFGYLKNADKNEFIVQKAVELGVSRIVAFSSEYSSAYMNGNKLERLNKVAREATKQCLRSVAPNVEFFASFEETLSALSKNENKIFACEFAEKSEISLSPLSGSTAIVIGSEGGFSEAEAELAKSRGFSFVSLGRRILRAETAAVALVSVCMFSLGELGMNADTVSSEEKI